MHKSEIELGRLAYSVADAASMLGISRHLLYDAIRNGEIIPKRCGTRTLIIADRLRAYLDGLPDGIDPQRSPNARRSPARVQKQKAGISGDKQGLAPTYTARAGQRASKRVADAHQR